MTSTKLSALLTLFVLLLLGATLPLTAAMQSASHQNEPVATPAGDQPEIVGGHDAEPGAWPWIVAVLKSGISDPYQAQFCGGALVAPTWVLTAGHCVQGLTASDLDVLLGAYKLSNGGDRISVIEIVRHPNFNNSTLDSDLALLHLARASTQPTVTLVPQGDATLTAPGVNATVIGWGDMRLNGQQGTYADVLQEVTVPIVSNQVCNAPGSYNGQITGNMMCAGYAQGGKDACQGDSGGPLVVPDASGTGWLQAGIVSWGFDCAKPNYYGVYTRLSNFTTWIATQTGQQSTPTATTAAPTPTPTATDTPTPSTTTPPSSPTATPTPTQTSTPTPTPSPTPTPTIPPISDVRFANIRDASFSVSWLTEDVVTGTVQVSISPPNGVRSGRVWRSAAGQAHLVTVTGLLPETTYYVTVMAGEEINDNHGRGFRVTTGPTLTLPSSDNVYGVVRKGDGSPADGCVVLANLVNRNVSGSPGQSALLAAQTDSAGNWTINLGNARTEALDAPFVYSDTGDWLSLLVQCSPTSQTTATVDTGADTPVADMQLRTLSRTFQLLDAGWNLIAFPATPLRPYTASRLCEELDRNTAEAPAEIVRWLNGGWDGYVCGVAANDFELVTSVAYFVRNQLPTFWAPAGDPIPASSTPDLVVGDGWNAVNGVTQLPGFASDLCGGVAPPANAQEVNRWWASGWDGHVCGHTFNDFGLVSAQGYFLKASIPPRDRSSGPTLPRLSQEELGGVRGLTVANLRDTSATIIWKTDQPSTGQVNVYSGGSLVVTAYDVRGAQHLDRLHFAVLPHLTPATSYEFDVTSAVSGRRVAAAQGAFTTLHVPTSVPRSRTAYGRILQSDGASPLAGGVLLAYVVDEDGAGSAGRSLLMAALLDDEGYWTINLGNARESGGDPFESGQADMLELAVETADGVALSRGLSVADTYPAPTLQADAQRIYLPQVMQ